MFPRIFLIARGLPALALAAGVSLAAAGCGGGSSAVASGSTAHPSSAVASSSADSGINIPAMCKAFEATWTSFLAGTLPGSASGGHGWDALFQQIRNDTTTTSSSDPLFLQDADSTENEAALIADSLGYQGGISNVTSVRIAAFNKSLKATATDCGTTLTPLPSSISSLPAVDQ